MTQTRPKQSDKKVKSAEIKLTKLLHRIKSLKLNDSYVSRLSLPSRSENRLKCSWKCIFALLLLLVMCSLGYYWYTELYSERCLLQLPPWSSSWFRPPEDCSMCAGVRGVARLANVSAAEFESLYAYGPRPAIVTDGAEGWKALGAFSYDFFKRLYTSSNLGKQINECFYFPYKSGLKSMHELFSMEEGRVNLSGDPWYVGWSTCYSEETRVLRDHYSRPYFLPKTAESDMIDWIFMGGPGQGAHMHVDSVRRMSWQAQVRGRKRWELAPPPECRARCSGFSFDVLPGEILVVDTNRWYHRTHALPGGISVTIGAEYD